MQDCHARMGMIQRNDGGSSAGTFHHVVASVLLSVGLGRHHRGVLEAVAVLISSRRHVPLVILLFVRATLLPQTASRIRLTSVFTTSWMRKSMAGRTYSCVQPCVWQQPLQDSYTRTPGCRVPQEKMT